MNPQEIPTDELEDYCRHISRDLMKDHERRFADRIRSVKEASVGLENASTRLAGGVRNAWGTLEKQASEYGLRLAQTIQEKSHNISTTESKSDFRGAEQFHKDAIKGLNETIVAVRRYAPKLHRTLKPEMATLNSSLMRLEKSLGALGEAIEESPGIKLELINREAKSLLEKQTESFSLKSQQRDEESALQKLSSQEREILSEDETLSSAPEFVELSKYENAAKRIEEELKQLLQPLTKPLLKLERSFGSREGSSVDPKALRNLIDTPMETIATGQLFASISLLDSLEEALRKGELGLDERKRRKAEEAIEAAKKGSMERMREEYLAVQANTQETLRQLRSTGLLQKREDLRRRLAETRLQIETSRVRMKDLQRRNDELSAMISKLKESIQSQIHKIARQTIVITT